MCAMHKLFKATPNQFIVSHPHPPPPKNWCGWEAGNGRLNHKFNSPKNWSGKLLYCAGTDGNTCGRKSRGDEKQLIDLEWPKSDLPNYPSIILLNSRELWPTTPQTFRLCTGSLSPLPPSASWSCCSCLIIIGTISPHWLAIVCQQPWEPEAADDDLAPV